MKGPLHMYYAMSSGKTKTLFLVLEERNTELFRVVHKLQ